MSDSQTQNPQAFFAKLFADNLSRVEGLMGEAHKFEEKSTEQAKKAIDESARLAHEGLSYSLALGEQWRKLSMDSLRRTIEMMSPKG